MKAAAPGTCAPALAASFTAAGADTIGFDRQGRLTYWQSEGEKVAVRSRLARRRCHFLGRPGFHQIFAEDSAGAHVTIEVADRATWSVQVSRQDFLGGITITGTHLPHFRSIRPLRRRPFPPKQGVSCCAVPKACN